MRTAMLILLCAILGGCKLMPQPDPILTASCPQLTPLSDPSFGATTLKLIEVAGQYKECRCAALPKECKQ